MKQLYSLILLLIGTTTLAQVGIGTDNPQSDLHVNGDVLVQEGFICAPLSSVTTLDEDFKLLTRSTSSNPMGKITELNVDARYVAPVNVVDYSFTGISLDNLTDVDLQYDTSKYVVAVSNFRYVGDPIEKIPISGTSTYTVGHFVIRTFESGGTWHLEIRNRSLDLDPSDTVDYHVTLIVYDKSFFRNMPVITTDLGGSNSGTASSIPNLY